MVGHTKDYCRQDDHRQDIRFVQTKFFFGIFQEHDLHEMKDFHYNMKNEQACACAICEVKSHSTTECQLNLKTDRTIKQSIKQMFSLKIITPTIMKGIIEYIISRERCSTVALQTLIWRWWRRFVRVVIMRRW